MLTRYFRTSVLAPPLADTPNIEKLNGSSFGRPDMDLMFARWAFNKNVPHMALLTCDFAHLPMHMHNHRAERRWGVV